MWDWEAIQHCQAGCWGLLFSGGVRFAHISQAYNAFRNGKLGPVDTVPIPVGLTTGSGRMDTDTDNLFSGHSFDGAGLTFSAEARRQFGQSGLALYGSARGSLLYGRGIQRASMTSVLTGIYDPPINEVSTFNSTLLDSATSGGATISCPSANWKSAWIGPEILAGG